MKVTVKDNYLNVRVGKPSVNAPCYQFIAPGSQIEVDGKLYKGDKFGDSNIDTWLKDAAGNYYWSGGIDTLQHTLLSAASGTVTNSQWWYQKLRISDLQKLTLPFSDASNIVTVAILDTGVVSNASSPNVFNVISAHNFTNATSNISDAKSGHGTLCASLIGASDKTFGSINPLVNIIIGKIFTDMGATNDKILAQAITSLCDPTKKNKVDIISISGGLDGLSNSSPLANAISFAQQQSVLVSAAIGNRLQTETGFYPALYSYVISIGALDQNFQYSTTLNPGVTKIDYLIPGENIRSLNYLNSITEFDGTSHACAIMSGILSLIMIKIKAKKISWNASKMRSFLNSSSDKVISPDGSLMNRLNPDLLIENVQKL